MGLLKKCSPCYKKCSLQNPYLLRVKQINRLEAFA